MDMNDSDKSGGNVASRTPSVEDRAGSHATSHDGQDAPNGRRDPFISASPWIILVPAVLVFVFSIAAGVLYGVAWHTLLNRWQDAHAILGYVSSAIYLPGILVGLATLATARSEGTTALVERMARLLLLAGVAVVVLGIADVVCIHYGNLNYANLPHSVLGPGLAPSFVNSYIFDRLAWAVFFAAVLGGLAYLCFRQASHLKSSAEEPLQKPGD